MNRGWTAFLVGMALSSGVGAAPWCKLDDPAAFRAAKQAQGKEDESAVTCPAIEPSQRLPDQLILPMPCGHKMVFRKIVVGTETVLDNVDVNLGEAADPASLLLVTNGPRVQKLAAGFSQVEGQRDAAAAPDLAKLKGRAYYIAKYEVTAPQYRLYAIGAMAPDSAAAKPIAELCKDQAQFTAELRETRIRPAAGISWFDAVNFSRAYNTWLLDQDRALIKAGKVPNLPWEQGSPSFVRLPTEVEWEYAARAAAVTRQDAGLKTYRIRDGDGAVRLGEIDEVAALSSASDNASDSPLSGVGRKAANLIGLHDMIGNAEEIVFDLFRLTRPDDLHGQAGGYIVKGGSVLTDRNTIGIGHRREVPFFQLTGETRSELTGFRLAVSVPVFVGGITAGHRWETGRQNPMLFSAMTNARAKLTSTGDVARDTAGQDLARLKNTADQGKADASAVAREVAAIQSKLEESNVRLVESDRQTRRERFKAATLLAYNIRAIGASVLSTSLLLGDLDQKVADPAMSTADRNALAPQLERLRQRIGEMEQSLGSSFAFYVDTVGELAKAGRQEVDRAADAVAREFGAQGVALFERYQQMALAHARRLVETRGALSDAESRQWLRQIDETRERREQRLRPR